MLLLRPAYLPKPLEAKAEAKASFQKSGSTIGTESIGIMAVCAACSSQDAQPDKPSKPQAPLFPTRSFTGLGPEETQREYSS